MNTAQFVTFLFFLFRSYDPMRKLRVCKQHEQAFAAAHHVWEVMTSMPRLREGWSRRTSDTEAGDRASQRVVWLCERIALSPARRQSQVKAGRW